MKHSAKDPIHKWVTVDTTWVDGVEFFEYRCSRCGGTTLNGQPLPKDLADKDSCTTRRVDSRHKVC